VLCRFEHTDLVVADWTIEHACDSAAVGESLGKELDRKALQPIVSALVLSDGLHVNGTSLVNGLARALRGVSIFGGLAGDSVNFKSTWVLSNGAISERKVVAVGFCGERFRTSHGSGGGGTIFGPERTVTRAEGNILFELDGQPALSLYKNYLGDLAEGLPATALLFPLAIRVGNADHTIVRTVLSVNETDQSMTFAGDLPEGATAQLLRSTPDQLIDAAGDAVRACVLESRDAQPRIAGPRRELCRQTTRPWRTNRRGTRNRRRGASGRNGVRRVLLLWGDLAGTRPM
jgi:hypothetical protein